MQIKTCSNRFQRVHNQQKQSSFLVHAMHMPNRQKPVQVQPKLPWTGCWEEFRLSRKTQLSRRLGSFSTFGMTRKLVCMMNTWACAARIDLTSANDDEKVKNMLKDAVGNVSKLYKFPIPGVLIILLMGEVVGRWSWAIRVDCFHDALANFETPRQSDQLVWV